MPNRETGFEPPSLEPIKEETIQQRLDRVKKTAGVPVISKEHLENLSKGFHEAALLEQQFRTIEKLASIEDDEVQIFVKEWIKKFQNFKDNPDPHKKHPGVFEIPMSILASNRSSGRIEVEANSDTIEMEKRYKEREKRLSEWVKKNIEQFERLVFKYLTDAELVELGYITHEESLEKRKKRIEGDAVEIKGETE